MKYTVKAGNHTFSETNNFCEALKIFRKLFSAGLHPYIMDVYGIIKD